MVFALGTTGFLSSIGLAVYLISEKKLKTAGLIFGIYISILPALSPIQVSWFIADRYLYLTTVFFAILMALLIRKVFKQKAALYVTLLIGTLYAYRDFTRGMEWQTRKSLWEATARTNPRSSKVYNNLGDVYGLEGNLEKSIAAFETAIELDPNYAEAMYNLGKTYFSAGEKEKGQELMNKALQIKPHMLE